MSEFRRILFSRKTILIILLAVFLNCIFFVNECKSEKQITAAGQELQDYINNYPDFLDSIINNSKNIGILAVISDDSGFVENNIDKTISDYGRLNNTILEPGENRGIVIYSNFIIADVLLIAVVLTVVMSFATEKEKGLNYLVRSTKNGRSLLVFHRALIILLSSLVTSLVLTTSCMVTSLFCIGSADISRPLQSVPEFSLCALPISIGEYLLLSALLKALSATIVGLLILLFLTWFGTVPSIAITGVIVGIEYLLSALILATDRLAGLKLVNIATMLRTDIYFKYYCNLNLSGKAIGFITLAIGVFIALIILLSVTASLLSAHTFGSITRLKTLDKIKILISEHAPNPPTIVWELKKIFINQKGILILIIVIYMAISACLEYGYYYQINTDRDNMYKKYGGVITSDTVENINADHQELLTTLNELQNELDKLYLSGEEIPKIENLQNQIANIKGDIELLEEIQKQAEDGYHFSIENDIEIELIKTDAYKLLLVEDKPTTDRNSMFILLAMIGIFSGIITYEKAGNMGSELKTLKNGRNRLIFFKTFTILATAPLLVLAISSAQFIQIRETVGYNNLSATVQSLEFLRGYPLVISIKHYLIITYGIRIFFTYIAGLFVMLISHLSPNRITSLCVSIAVLAVPAILSIAGLDGLKSILDLISYN